LCSVQLKILLNINLESPEVQHKAMSATAEFLCDWQQCGNCDSSEGTLTWPLAFDTRKKQLVLRSL